MNEIAFFMENSRISYVSLFVVLGASAALLCSILTAVMYKVRLGPVTAGAALSVITGTLFSRLVYWYCCPEQFDSISDALFDFSSGGFSLVGVFAGVLLAAVIIRISGLVDNLLTLFDCYAPGAALGIAVGRLGGFFSTDDKGNFVFADDRFFCLPFSIAVKDSVTGSIEWRFASFFWESIAGFAIFAALILMIFMQPSEDGKRRPGVLFMTFLSLFGATQAALESTRYDALRMRSNGFISMMQLAALIMLLLPLVYYSVKLLRSGKNILRALEYWGISLAVLTGAGILEYYIQRKANLAMILHPAQLVCLLACSLVTLLIALRVYRAAEQPVEPAA